MHRMVCVSLALLYATRTPDSGRARMLVPSTGAVRTFLCA